MSRLTTVSLSLALIVALGVPAFAKTEKEFLSDAIKGDNSEVALGQLAISKAGSDPMKTFGQMLVDDHSKHRNEAMSLATKLGVSPSSEMTPEARREMDRLQKLTGPEFDRAFNRLMIQDHEKDISEFKKEAASGQGSVQQFAAQSLPVLEKHLQMSRSLESAK
ncbi:MAG TPA: DUF4142 domain-containing protein [Roseiarcus sp.]|nr:DUF4142 domain-containing protein [Roseiarcus sp.]